MRRQPPVRPVLLHGWVPWAVLVITLLLTGTAAGVAYSMALERDRARFDHAVQETAAAIQGRLETYITILRGGAALFAASDEVTRDEFRRYVEELALGERYPGIQGIGFAARMPPGRVDSVVAALRRQGIPDFHVWPDRAEPGPEPQRYAIVYLEPLDRRNRAALGFDMFTEPVRRAAMARARDSGWPVASDRVVLMQEIDRRRQAGFLIYLPMYRGGDIPPTVETRREQLLGFIYSPFRVDDLLLGIFPPSRRSQVDFRLFSDSAPSAATLLHDSRTLALPRSRSSSREHVTIPTRSPASTTFRRFTTMRVAGRSWGLEFTSGPAFDSGSARDLIQLILAAGLVVSAILFELSRAQVRAQRRIAAIGAELLRTEQAVREAQKQESIGLLAGGIAHDFNNLLMGILGNASFALSAMPPADPARGVLDDVVQAAQRAAHLTDQLLAYAGKRHVDLCPVDLCEVLRDAASLVEPSLPRPVRFELKMFVDCALVEGDPYHLQQLFVGLIMNGVEAIGERDGAVRVSVRHRELGEAVRDISGGLPPGAYIEINVEDTGGGMDEETLRRIFDPFFTTKFMGRGLGLAAAQGIVRSHKGAIVVRSIPGQGSAFTVLFPSRR